ncbi:MAG TPA: hypothetical protein VIH35_08350 [Kiritimatiellia bacterium]|jgi:hypothetical protein
MKARTLRFPEGSPLGYLHTRQGGYPYSFHGRFKKEGGLLEGTDNPGWTLHGEARGAVTVDADVVLLEVLAEPARDLSPLAKLKPGDLDALWLGNTWANDDQLRHVAHLTGLRWIDLQNNMAITDAGMAHLAGLASLVHLGMHWTKVTGAGLRHVYGRTNLQFLDIWGCPVSAEAVAEFKARFPNCNVRT